MNIFLFVFSFILAVALVVWVWYMFSKKMPAHQIASRMSVASVLFLFFTILNLYVIFRLIETGNTENTTASDPVYFHISNDTSEDLIVTACFSYLHEEINSLIQQGVYINPLNNFITYNFLLPATDETSGVQSMITPIPATVDIKTNIPENLYITVCDSTGYELFRLNSDNIGNYADMLPNSFYWSVTDSLIRNR